MNIASKLTPNYQNYPPFKYEIILVEEVSSCAWYERYIQSYFIEHQIKGEWFIVKEEWGDLKEKVYKVFNALDGATKQIIKNRG